MTVRMGSCQSLIDDDFHVNMLYDLYDSLDKSCTPLSIMAPWIPFWGNQRRTKIIRQMSEVVQKFVNERRKANTLGEDTIDVLIRDGLDDVGIINVSTNRFQ
jgi:cytochrome P450